MKNNQKQVGLTLAKKSQLGNVSLYENSNELENLSESELFIFENQKSDLKGDRLTLEKFSKELVFFDLLMKENEVNKKILSMDIQKKKEKLCKMFINEFYFVNTPNEKNYEKLLLEKLNNKFIIQYIENSYNGNDVKDLQNIKNLLDDIENLKENYRIIGVKNMDDKQAQKELVKDFRKQYQKLKQKELKAKYRLCKKYNFLVSE